MSVLVSSLATWSDLIIRTDAVVTGRKDGAKSHLRYSRIVNPCGPQTNDYMDKSHDPLQSNVMAKKMKEESKDETGPSLPLGIAERVMHLEKKLGNADPVPKDIYARIKALEDRVSFLEGASPEYFQDQHLLHRALGLKATASGSDQSTTDSQGPSLSDINSRIQQLQSTLKIKNEPTS